MAEKITGVSHRSLLGGIEPNARSEKGPEPSRPSRGGTLSASLRGHPFTTARQPILLKNERIDIPTGPITEQESQRLTTWATSDPLHTVDRLEFVGHLEKQLARPANQSGVASMAYAVRDGVDAVHTGAFLDAPPLPAGMTTLFVPTAEMKKAFDKNKDEKKISDQISVEVLPEELTKQCINLPLWRCNEVDNRISETGSTEGIATSLQRYKDWQKKCDPAMAVTARINGAAIGEADRLILTDLKVDPEPPPSLPPCIKEIYVRDQESARAFKANFPSLKILCLSTLSEKLAAQGGSHSSIEFDPISKLYFIEDSENRSGHFESEEGKHDYRQLAEFYETIATPPPVPRRPIELSSPLEDETSY